MILTLQSIDDVYWTEDAADEDMMNTYCWMYGHLNLPHDYMVLNMTWLWSSVNTYCWMYGHLNLPHNYMVVKMMNIYNDEHILLDVWTS